MSDTAEPPAVPMHRPVSLGVKILLWVLAIVLAGAAMVYQRATGPTYPKRGQYSLGDEVLKYALLRSQETSAKAKIEVPAPKRDAKATLFWKRWPSEDAFTSQPMSVEVVSDSDGKSQEVFQASLPIQPSAGKIEYYVAVFAEDDSAVVPVKEDKDKSGPETVILRYKDPVPDAVLFPHVTLMILTIIFGMRAGLAALYSPHSMRLYAWLAFGCMTVGGMTLGPIVQKYAFGEYWTGFPWGGDWTDNKTLIMWGAWLFAVVLIGFNTKRNETPSRLIVLLANTIMIATYLIPHSMGGSQLDYSKVDAGLDPREAIETGRQE